MTDARRNKVLQIFRYATLLNDDKTKRTISGSKPTVFIDFYGHEAIVDVRIHDSGWEPMKDPSEFYSIYFNDCFSKFRIFPHSYEELCPTDMLLNRVYNRLKNLYQAEEDKQCKTTE